MSERVRLIDLMHLGRPEVIASALIELDGALALVDPGPGSTVDRLISELSALGVSPADLDAVLLTHIHLDHAGATGHLAEQNPNLRVYVHQRGARHMIDPTKLIASAARLWGDDMQRLWGDFLAVPADRVAALDGGETIELGGDEIEVLYTPGHAKHHVSYLDVSGGTAFVGDTGGCRISGAPFVLPPTPPPDVDLDAWLFSATAIEAWAPERLLLTHFGFVTDIAEHFAELHERLPRWADMVRQGLPAEVFEAAIVMELTSKVGKELAETYLASAPSHTAFPGLARFWDTR